MKWYVDNNGREFGPLTTQEIQHEAKEGRITQQTKIRREGEVNSVSAGSIAGLFTTTERKAVVSSQVKLSGDPPSDPRSEDLEPANPKWLPAISGALVTAIVCMATFFVYYAIVIAPPQQPTASKGISGLAKLETGEDVSSEFDELLLVGDDDISEEELDEFYASWIDEASGHPDDKSMPLGVLGASDEVLLATDPRELVELIETTREFAEGSKAPPRLLFALGRAAMFAGYDQLASELLQKAADRGSAGAVAYQGFLAEEQGQLIQAVSSWQKAVNLGFRSTDVEVALRQVTEGEPAASLQGGLIGADDSATELPAFDKSNFSRPDIVQALHDHDLAYLRSNKADVMLYLMKLHETISEQSILFHVMDRRFMLEIDPSVSTSLAKKLLRSPDVQGEVMQAGLGSYLGMFKAMADARRGGASIMGEYAAVSNSLADSGLIKFEDLEKKANQDAVRLAGLFDSDKPAFRKIYSGIKDFANE